MGVLGKPFVSRLSKDRSYVGGALKSEAPFNVSAEIELPYNADMTCSMEIEGHKTVYPLASKCLTTAGQEIKSVWEGPCKEYGVVTMAMSYGDGNEKKFGIALDTQTFHHIFSQRDELKKELAAVAKEEVEAWNAKWGGAEHVRKREKFEKEFPLRELVTSSYSKPVINKFYLSATNFFTLGEI